MKAGFEARARARREKEREKEEKEREERREEEEREMDLAGWSRKLRQEQEVRDLSWLMFMEWTLLSRLWWEKLKTEHVERRLWQIGRAQLLRLGWRTSLPLLPTTGYQKPKSEKGTEVRLPKNNYTSVYSFRIEDMFGADDADWAIYRKIVIYQFLMIESQADVFFNRMLQRLTRTRKTTFHNFRSLNRNCWPTIPRSLLKRLMHQWPHNDLLWCPLSDLPTMKVT